MGCMRNSSYLPTEAAITTMAPQPSLDPTTYNIYLFLNRCHILLLFFPISMKLMNQHFHLILCGSLCGTGTNLESTAF